jgi:excisionase family DNA binding protein
MRVSASSSTERRISVHIAALRLGRCRHTVYALIRAGELRAKKTGARGRFRILESDLEEILQRRNDPEKAR